MHSKVPKPTKEGTKKTGAQETGVQNPTFLNLEIRVFSLLKKRKNREKQYLIGYWLRVF